MNYNNRKELFRALVGSHNYNLNSETSDKDYKVFVVPTFDDLYTGNMFSSSKASEAEDIETHDIRKLSSMFWKSNVSYLEILFSNETHINTELSKESKEILNSIRGMKNDIVKMNLPYLYNACIGTHISRKKDATKNSKQVNPNELNPAHSNNYNTKAAMNSIRILDFLRRFADSDFNNFKFAIEYNSNDDFRELLFDIKNGIYSEEQFIKIADNLLKEIETNYKSIYLSEKPNSDTNDKLVTMTKKLIRLELD